MTLIDSPPTRIARSTAPMPELVTSESHVAIEKSGFLTFRAAILGFSGVAAIAVVTPFNNFVVDQAGVVGNSLSIGAVCFCVLIVGVLNAVLHRLLPQRALRRNEIAVALGMVLVGCAIPGVGLMRYLPGHLVGPFYHASQDPTYADLLRSIHLPDWLFPDFVHTDPADRGGEPIVQQFYNRVQPVGENTFWDRLTSTPWAAWRRPMATWGVLVFLLLSAVMCLTVIFRRQWVDNERLSFPLATVYAAMIEPPEAGRSFNRLFRSRGFQWASAAVFFVQFLNGMNQYYPGVPTVPLQFDIRGILADSPFWSNADLYFSQQQIYFTVIGVAFFLRANVLSSLVFFYLASSILGMSMRSGGTDLTLAIQNDHQFSSALVLLTATLWVARDHLKAVLRQMIGRPRPLDPIGFYLPYALAGWGVLGAAIGMTVWLTAAGVSLGGAMLLVTMLLAVMLLVARVVAETGFLYVLIATPLTQPMSYAAPLAEGNPLRTTMGSYFIGRVLSNVFNNDTREALPNFSTTALRLTDGAVDSGRTTRRSAMVYVGLLLAALVVSYVISSGSTLYCFYHYAATLGSPPKAPLQEYATQYLPRLALDATVQFTPGRPIALADSHWPGFAAGAGGTLLLSVLSLRFAAWPLAPVGYLLCNSWGVKMTWFSLLLGLLAKQLLVRLGGSKLIQSAQPIFIGLIVGEVAAVLFWMVTALALAWTGHEYRIVQLLPI